jgi:hypothetical protein
MRNWTFPDNRPSSCSQRTSETLPPHTKSSYHVPRRPPLDRGTSPRPSRYLHIFWSGFASISSQARVQRTFKDPRWTTDTYHTPCGTSTHHTTAPAHGPPQASSINAPRQPRCLPTQGSHQLHTRLPPTGLNSSGSQTSLQRPLPSLVSERQNTKTPCARKTHHRVYRQGQACLHIQRGLWNHYLQTCDYRNPNHNTWNTTTTFNDQDYMLQTPCPFSCTPSPTKHQQGGGGMWESSMESPHMLWTSITHPQQY